MIQSQTQMDERSELLDQIYHDPSNQASFSSPERLWQEARNKIQGLTLKQTKEWLASQFTYTLHRQARRKFPRNRVLASRINEHWQGDLVDMHTWKDVNDGIPYLLVVIDVFSKRASVKPLRTKSGVDVTNAFCKTVNELGKPDNLMTDEGKEFVNQYFKSYCEKNQINFFVANNKDTKAPVVERLNRTLKARLFKFMTHSGSRRFVDVIPKIVNAYNNSYHRTIKMRPSDVNENNSSRVFQNIYGFRTKRDYLLNKRSKGKLINEGQLVRVKHPFGPLDKGYFANWKDETFRIKASVRKERPTYRIVNGKGEEDKRQYYREELQRVTEGTYRVEKILKRDKRRKRVLVKWIGYPDSANSWEPEDNIIHLR